MDLVGIEDIREAVKRFNGRVVRTPLLPFREGGQSWLKPESLQPTGAFKLRGALNAMGVLAAEHRNPRGVVAYSSGNHGRAVAWAARAYGVPAVVVMQDDSPGVKVDAVAALGAEVVLAPAPERDRRAAQLQAERGLALLPPFDHADVIAGQGTVGLEIVEDLPEVDTVLVPVSGGGLVAGVATAVKALQPRARVVAVEPDLAGDLAEGLAAGRRVRWDYERTRTTIADALRAPSVGELPWRHISRFVDEAVTVSEDSIRAAMAALAVEARLVAEPSGAVAAAAYLSRPEVAVGRTVAVVSGGSVDPALLAEVLRAR